MVMVLYLEHGIVAVLERVLDDDAGRTHLSGHVLKCFITAGFQQPT